MPHLHRTARELVLGKRAYLKRRKKIPKLKSKVKPFKGKPKTKIISKLTKDPERARMEAALGTLRTHGRAYISGLPEEELKKRRAAGRKAKIKRRKKKKKTATELLAEYVKRTGKPKVK